MMKKDIALEYLKEIREICKTKKYLLRTLAKIGKKQEYPLITIKINPNAKRTICFSAGIHGNEIAGQLSLLKFLKNYNSNKFKRIQIIVFPLLNPYGYTNNIRRNYNDFDLNRHFNKNLKKENKLLIKYIKEQNVVFFHALHEDLDEKRFYIYLFETQKEPIYDKILDLAKKHIPLDLDKKIYKDKSSHGLIINDHDGSFEDYMFLNNVPFSMCTETPGKQKLEKRIKLNLDIMKLVIKYCENYTGFN
jgi:hypothetical protein